MHVLESSASEIMSDSRRQTTSCLVSAPTRFGGVTGPTMASPHPRVGLPLSTSVLKRAFRPEVPTTRHDPCTGAVDERLRVVRRFKLDALSCNFLVAVRRNSRK